VQFDRFSAELGGDERMRAQVRKLYAYVFLDGRRQQCVALQVGIVFLSTERADQLLGAVEEIRDLLRARHRLLPNEDDDFTIRTMDDIAKASEGTSRTMMLMLLGIASISLVVGGIGVMNILLVSVTERTHEIGLRMAVGARSRDILAQFLVEALTISLIGGIIGIVVGVAVSAVIGAP